MSFALVICSRGREGREGREGEREGGERGEGRGGAKLLGMG